MRASEWLQRQWLARGWLAWLLWPLSWLTWTAIATRALLYRLGVLKTTHPGLPVVVVGNLYVGGTGKTPLTCALAQMLMASGWRPGLISRGYGSQDKRQPATGQGSNLDWRIYGDEPALIARLTGIPVAVHPDRIQAAKALGKFDPTVNVILCDDGLQHHALGHDMALLVEDSRGVGNGFLMPAGPLREPSSRRQRVDAVFLRDSQGATDPHGSPPVFEFSVDIVDFYCPTTGQSMPPQTLASQCQPPSRCLAIAGIGVPTRFFSGLLRLGVPVHETLVLADHQPLAPGQIESIDATTILMTEKDAIKCGDQLDARCWVARTAVSWKSPGVQAWVATKMKAVVRRLAASHAPHRSR